MTSDLFTTAQAAEYCGLTEATIRKHIYVTGILKGTKIGNTLVFTKQELDGFLALERPVGRPPKESGE